MTAEPLWIDAALMLDLHQDIIRLSGGSAGVRDRGLLESALARPQNLHAYEGVNDLIVLAATYAVAVSGNHPFIDGNKRAAFVCMGQFLEDNDLRLVAETKDAAATFLDLAAGLLDLQQLTDWLRRNVESSA